MLDTEYIISHIRAALVDPVTSLQGSDVGVIAASEVHELHARIHDILNSATSKQVSNMTYILAYHFNSASRWH